MVSKTRLEAVIHRRIESATKRGDNERRKKLCAILIAMNTGAITPGQALMDIRLKPPSRKTQPIITLAGKIPFRSQIREQRKQQQQLRGGL